MAELTVRRMQLRDLEAGLRLTQAQRWSHRLEDWEFHFRLGRGWVVCDEHDRPVGTALWWAYGDAFATVGLVVVAPDRQGKGIGRLLLKTVMEDAGPRVLRLVATQAGRKLYEQCGFREVGAIAQHQGVSEVSEALNRRAAENVSRQSPGGLEQRGPEKGVLLSRPAIEGLFAAPSGITLRAARREDLPALCELDAEAFGADRRRLIAAVAEAGEGVVAQHDGRIVAFALKRQSGRGTLIGPVVASDERVAIALVSRLLSETTGFTRIDIPTDATELASWLEAAGLPAVDRVTTMVRNVPAVAAAAPAETAERRASTDEPGAGAPELDACVFALTSQAFS